ncbi:MAG TPA: sugar ABC transporter permease, partial [Halobacteriales archaeon]|nr:sugar ABC transporter permease [Halobacteriales archaeon]
MVEFTSVESWLRSRRVLEHWNEDWLPYLFVLPTTVFLAVLIWGMFLRGIWMSLHVWPLVGANRWVGLHNYAYLLQWQPFHTALWVTAIYGSATVFQLLIALLSALAVVHVEDGRLKTLIIGIFILPYAVPQVVTGTIWSYLLNPNFGPITAWLLHFNVLSQPLYWGTRGGSALAVITWVSTWTFWPFMFLILMASLESIPSSYYEAAHVYGASRWDMFRRITLPQIKSAILITFVIRLTWNLIKIAQPFQLTKGGPGYSTSVLGVLVYRFAFKQQAM